MKTLARLIVVALIAGAPVARVPSAIQCTRSYCPKQPTKHCNVHRGCWYTPRGAIPIL